MAAKHRTRVKSRQSGAGVYYYWSSVDEIAYYDLNKLNKVKVDAGWYYKLPSDDAQLPKKKEVDPIDTFVDNWIKENI